MSGLWFGCGGFTSAYVLKMEFLWQITSLLTLALLKSPAEPCGISSLIVVANRVAIKHRKRKSFSPSIRSAPKLSSTLCAHRKHLTGSLTTSSNYTVHGLAESQLLTALEKVLAARFLTLIRHDIFALPRSFSVLFSGSVRELRHGAMTPLKDALFAAPL